MAYFVFAIDRSTGAIVDEAESSNVANGEKFAEAIRKSSENLRHVEIVEVCATTRDAALELDSRLAISA